MKTGHRNEAAGNSKKHKLLRSTLCSLLVALSFSVEAQQAKKVPLIGYLPGSSFSTAKRNVDAIRQGLRELGYAEGKTFSLSTDGQTQSSTDYPPLRPSWSVSNRM